MFLRFQKIALENSYGFRQYNPLFLLEVFLIKKACNRLFHRIRREFYWKWLNNGADSIVFFHRLDLSGRIRNFSQPFPQGGGGVRTFFLENLEASYKVFSNFGGVRNIFPKFGGSTKIISLVFQRNSKRSLAPLTWDSLQVVALLPQNLLKWIPKFKKASHPPASVKNGRPL